MAFYKIVWSSALSYFAKKTIQELNSDVPSFKEESASDCFLRVLESIDALDIMSPIEILNILSKQGGIPLKLIKPYLIKKLEKDQYTLDEVLSYPHH